MRATRNRYGIAGRGRTATLRWVLGCVSVLALGAAGCRFGAGPRLQEEPPRVEVVYHEAEPITVTAPASTPVPRGPAR